MILPYAEIPHSRSGVSGHAGRLVAGSLEGRRVLLFLGRAHYYETGDAGSMRVPVALVQALAIPALIVTNAAGSVHARIRPGSLVAVSDHLNLSGANPLLGDHTENRFVSLTGAYDPGLRGMLQAAARTAEVDLPEGVYVWLSGPSFETPAEIRMIQAPGVTSSACPRYRRSSSLAIMASCRGPIRGHEPRRGDRGCLALARGDQKHGSRRVRPVQASHSLLSCGIAPWLMPLSPMPRPPGGRSAVSILRTCPRPARNTRSTICARERPPARPRGGGLHLAAIRRLARAPLRGTPVHIATVVNFPAGGEDVDRVIDDLTEALGDGAQEIDLVLPYEAVRRGDLAAATAMVAAVRDVVDQDRLLKVILETGELRRTAPHRNRQSHRNRRGRRFHKDLHGQDRRLRNAGSGRNHAERHQAIGAPGRPQTIRRHPHG